MDQNIINRQSQNVIDHSTDNNDHESPNRDGSSKHSINHDVIHNNNRTTIIFISVVILLILIFAS
jgi:hypothetical protein